MTRTGYVQLVRLHDGSPVGDRGPAVTYSMKLDGAARDGAVRTMNFGVREPVTWTPDLSGTSGYELGVGIFDEEDGDVVCVFPIASRLVRGDLVTLAPVA